jgi:DNA polymerase-3 subunit gamma/tau
MRDSQSLFDQLLAFGGKTIGSADVHRLLGTAPDERLIELGEELVNRKHAQALVLFDEAMQSGVQVGELTDQLLAYFRDLMVLAAGAGEALLLSVADEQRANLARQASAAGLQTVLAALQILAETKYRMKGAAFSRVLLELALVRIGTLDQLDNLSELVSQLRQGQSGGGSPAAPSVARATAAPSRERIEPSTQAGRCAAGPDRTAVGLGGETANQDVSEVWRSNLGDAVPEPIKTNVAPPHSSTESSVQPVATMPFEPGREAQIWTQVLAILSDMTKTHAKNVSRAAISGPNTLVLMFPKGYHLSKQYLERSPEQIRRIENALEHVVGAAIRVSLAEDDRESSAPREPRKEAPLANANNAPEPERDALVRRAMSVFGATVVKTESGVAPAGNQE